MLSSGVSLTIARHGDRTTLGAKLPFALGAGLLTLPKTRPNVLRSRGDLRSDRVRGQQTRAQRLARCSQGRVPTRIRPEFAADRGIGDQKTDGVGDLFGHVRQEQQRVVKQGPGGVQLDEGVDVQLALFIGCAGADAGIQANNPTATSGARAAVSSTIIANSS